MPPKRTAGKAQQPAAESLASAGDFKSISVPVTIGQQAPGRWTPLPVVKPAIGPVGPSGVSRAAVEAVGIDVACAAVARCCGVESLGYPTREHVMAAIHTLTVPGSAELNDRLGNGRASALLLASVDQVLREAGGGTGGRRVQEDVPPVPRRSLGETGTAKPHRATKIASAALDSVDRTLEAIEREISLSPVPVRDDDDDRWQLPRGTAWELHSSSDSSSDDGAISSRLSELLEDDAENEASGEDDEPVEQVEAAAGTETPLTEELLLLPPAQQQSQRSHSVVRESSRPQAGSESAATENARSGSRRTCSLRLVANGERPGLPSFDPEPAPSVSIRDAGEVYDSEPVSPTSDLTRAAKAGDVERVSELLRRGVPVDGEDFGGWSALHWAANRDNGAVAELLISGGQADVEKVPCSSHYASLPPFLCVCLYVSQCCIYTGWSR